MILAVYKTVQFGNILKRIQRISTMFHRSPVKNSILQKKINETFEKSLQLSTDVKTRWNSTEKMLERYIKLHDCVVEALKEIGEDQSLSITADELDLVKSLYDALQPVRLVSEALGRRDATLMTAEGSLNFLLNKLKSQKNPFSAKLYTAVLKRVNERRNTKLVSLMKLLQNSNSPSTSTDLPIIPRNQLLKFVKEECEHLYKIATHSSSLDDQSAAEGDKELSLEEELESMIQQHAETRNVPQKELSNLNKVIQKEFALFELTGELTPGLENMYKAVRSIKPTSTDSERVFSDSSNICTKKRSSLTDSSINELCFSKSYFKRVDKNLS